MAPPRDQVFVLDFERSGEVQPLRVVHHGLAYMGEAIAARHWDPSWGRPLEGDSYFRVVVHMEPATVRPEDVQDSRIAVCVPGRRRSARAWERSARELATLREARTLYQTGRGQAGGPIDGFLEEEQERLQDLVAEEEAGRYRAGYLQSPTVFSEDLDKIFEGPYPSAWVRRVAEALLLWAYPSLSLDPSLFPRALEPWDPGSIFEALFADHPGSKTALGQFGPGLGLLAPADPLSFDPEGTQGECRVFGHIREALEQRQGELPWTEIHYLLAHSIGLTQPLATLYLLTFVHHGAPPTELSLSVGQEHALRGRRLVRGAKLTREFVPMIPWEPGFWGNDPPMFPRFLSLRYPREEVTWNDALLYTSLLCPGLEEAGEEGSYSVQERRLMDAIGGLAADAERAAGVLRYLSMAIPSPNEDELRSALRRTSAVCQGQDYHQIYLLLRATYSDPRVLLDDLDALDRLNSLGEHWEGIVDAWEFVEGAGVAAGYHDLAVDRSALLQQITLQALLASPGAWPVVAGQVEGFRGRYRHAYAQRHAEYHRELSRLGSSLAESAQRVESLGILDEIPELGPEASEPAAGDLSRRLDDLGRALGPCDARAEELLNASAPGCPRCHMVLGAVPPSLDVDQLSQEVDRALGLQSRRLSRMLVGRILDGRVDQRLEDFLKIVQASDLSALCNSLDQDLARFISRILGDR